MALLGTPQTSVAYDSNAFKAGMPLDTGYDDFVESWPCGASALDFGVGVDLVSGVLVIAQGTSASGVDADAFRGVTMYKDSLEGPSAGASTPLPYQPGDMVPVMRKGRIAVQVHSGSTVAIGVAARLKHSSTLAGGENGLFTSEASSDTAGSEISDVGAKWYKDGGLASATPALAGIELNLP